MRATSTLITIQYTEKNNSTQFSGIQGVRDSERNMSFHLEALRRSKILARKKDAQFNLAAKYVEEKRSGDVLDAAVEEQVEGLCREYTFPRRIISTYSNPSTSPTESMESEGGDGGASKTDPFDRELWQAQKALRNSCLYMGPIYKGKGVMSQQSQSDSWDELMQFVRSSDHTKPIQPPSLSSPTAASKFDKYNLQLSIPGSSKEFQIKPPKFTPVTFARAQWKDDISPVEVLSSIGLKKP
eukprot:sb/3469045/